MEAEAEVNLIRKQIAPRSHDIDELWGRLSDMVGDARLVLLGEATHGSNEFYTVRAELTKRLITEKNFAAVAVEAGSTRVAVELLAAEAEIAMVERFDSCAMVVLTQRHGEQAAAGAQQSCCLGHRFRGMLGVGQRMQHQHQVEALFSQLQCMHVAL